MRKINFYYAPVSKQDARLMLANSARLLLGGRTVSQGPWSGRFEELIKDTTDCHSALTFPSARTALLALLKAMEIGEGDEVLVTGFTCVAVPSPVLLAGARPVYLDINPRTLNLDPSGIEGRITPRSKAIIVQHTFGNPCAMEPILDIARRHRLYVIEDCALALGSRYKQRPAGAWGDAAIISFELSKTITGGWGGIAWVNRDPQLSARLAGLQSQCEFLSRPRAAAISLQVALSFLLYHPGYYGLGRYIGAILYRTGVFRVSTTSEENRGLMPARYWKRLSDDHWRIIVNQFRRLDRILEQSRQVSHIYQQVLEAHGVNTFPMVLPGADPNWIRFPFLVPDRAGMQSYFAKKGIEVGQWFDSPISGATDYGPFGYQAGECPNAEFVSRHIVNLPVHVRLSKADVSKIAGALDAYLSQHPEVRELSETVNRRRGSAPVARGSVG